MDPHKFSVLELFAKPERYVIPLYQRRYIWTASRQWQPLWDDIQAKVKDVEEKGQDQVRPHFLGAIVVAKRQTSGNDLDIYDVVDGQQRLTTFQVFLLAFRDRVKQLDKATYQRIRAHTRNGNEDLEVREYEQYKVWPTRFDQPLFTEIWGHPNPEDLVQAVQEDQKQRLPVGNIKAAYTFFSEQLRLWLGEDPQRAPALFDALKRHLQVVRIDLHPGDDPQVIFETLNARGEALQAADLIRNFIFQHAEQQKFDVERLFQTYWADFDEDRSFWRESVSRGRVRRDQLTWFLTYFLTVQHGREISEGTIFDEFKTWWKKAGELTVEDRLIELRRYARAYLQLHRADVDTRLGILRVRLEALDTTTLTPVLLFLLTEPVPAPELDAILLNLESYLVRRYVVGLTSKNNNKSFLQLLNRFMERQREGDVSGEPPISAPFVRSFLSAGGGESVRWPDDDEFRAHLLNDPTYKKLKPRGVVLLLEAAEARLHSDRQEILRFAGTSSVEHVMPRRWEKHWDPPAAVAGVDSASLIAQRNALLHNLGNLTLVTQKLNTSMSNSGYTDKKPKITHQTLRMLNHYFQERTTWNETEIHTRAQQLADALIQTWPAPVEQTLSRSGPVASHPAVPQEVTTDAEQQFDRWLNETNGYFQVEELDVEGRQGVQFIHRSWSRSLKLMVYSHEAAGEERLTFEIRNDFGESDSFYVGSRAVFSRIKDLLELSFGESLSESEKGYRIHLDPDSSAQDLETVFDRVCTIFIPEVERALTTASAVTSPSLLNDVMLLTWPHLPEGATFLIRDLAAQRDYRRIGHASWPSDFRLSHKIIQRADGGFTLSLHDETNEQFRLKAELRQLWPELVRTVEQHFPGWTERLGTGSSQYLNVVLPKGVSLERVSEDLQRLISVTYPLLRATLDDQSRTSVQP